MEIQLYYITCLILMRLAFENILIISYGNINRLNNCYLIQRTGNVYRKDDSYIFISTVFILRF